MKTEKLHAMPFERLRERRAYSLPQLFVPAPLQMPQESENVLLPLNEIEQVRLCPPAEPVTFADEPEIVPANVVPFPHEISSAQPSCVTSQLVSGHVPVSDHVPT
jgi:hypothetical protein